MDFFKLLFYWSAGRLRRTFFMALPENEKDYADSRRAFILSEAANQTIVQFVSGTFLAAVLTCLGVSDGKIGTVMAVATLATVFDFFTMRYIQQLRKRKFFIFLMVLQKVWFAFLYFIPFMPWTSGEKIFWFVFFLSFAQICTQISTPAINDWVGELVRPEKRGTYFSMKDAISVFVTVTGMLGMGIVFDHFRAGNHLNSYPILGKSILVLVFFDLLGIMFMKEPREYPLNPQGKEMHGALRRRNERKQNEGMAGNTVSGIREAFRSGKFRTILVLTCLWNMAYYTAAPFNTSYQLKELNLSFTYIMVVSFLANLVRVFLTPVIGRKADSVGMVPMLELVLSLYAVGYVFMMLAVPENAETMFIISTIFSAIAWCFIGTGLFCIQLEFLEQKTRMFQFAVLTAISGLYGFFISAVMGRLIDHLQKYPPVFHGRTLYAQQVTNFLGIIVVAVMIGYLFFTVQEAEKDLH